MGLGISITLLKYEQILATQSNEKKHPYRGVMDYPLRFHIYLSRIGMFYPYIK